MISIKGIWWPDDVGTKWEHALRHVESVEWSLAHVRQHRTAVQAGGNIGLWPRRMAEVFDQVVTFEPEPVSLMCLRKNVPANVKVSWHALGDVHGLCDISHKSLGSHRVIDGDTTAVTTIDSQYLDDVDLIQLDVEGYEWHALVGATRTIAQCRPLIQVEIRDFTEKYGHPAQDILTLLEAWGYGQVSSQQGSDYVFAPKDRP